MRGIILIVVIVGAFILWSMTQGDSATVPDQNIDLPDVPPNLDEDVADGTEKAVRGMPDWGWKAVALVIILAVINSFRKKQPALFWCLVGLVVAGAIAAGAKAN